MRYAVSLNEFNNSFLLAVAVPTLPTTMPAAWFARVAASFTSVIIQILLLDIVFSLDSVITAVGMADKVAVMIAAVVIALDCPRS